MKFGKQLRLAMAGAFVLAAAGVANAASVFDTPLVDPPGFYNGTGNPNEGFTVNMQDGVEIGLGAHIRNTGPTLHPNPTNGSTYFAPAGFSTGTRAKWNFDFSVNLQAGPGNGGLHLSDITTTLTVFSVDNGQSVSFDALTIADNAGWNGAENLAAANLATDYGFQNSHNLDFGEYKSFINFNALLDNTYIITLAVTETASGNSLGSVQETIVVGTGTSVPVPAALPLFATGLGALGFLARRRRKTTAAA